MEMGEERVQASVAALLLSVCLAEVAGRRPTGTWITSGQDQDDAVKTRMRIIHACVLAPGELLQGLDESPDGRQIG